MSEQSKPVDLSIVIPAKNEERRLVPTLQSIAAFCAAHADELSVEVLVVENGSHDATAAVARSFAPRFQRLRVLELDRSQSGKGAAVREGVRCVAGEFVVFMDADNATHIEEINQFLPRLRAGVDVVIGSRHVVGSVIEERQPWLRRLMGRLANSLIRMTVLPGIHDTQCGFKAFRAEAAREIFALQEITGWGFDIEILAIARRLGYAIEELPVHWYHVGGSRLRPLKAIVHTTTDLLRVAKNLMLHAYENRRSGKK